MRESSSLLVAVSLLVVACFGLLPQKGWALSLQSELNEEAFSSPAESDSFNIGQSDLSSAKSRRPRRWLGLNVMGRSEQSRPLVQQYAQADPNSEEAEAVFWDEVKNLSDKDMLEAFLDAFPNGKFAAEAKAKLKGLQTAEDAAAPDVSDPADPPSAAPATPTADEVTRTPRVYRTGKWPAGLGWDGESLWVAESGKRRIARVDPNNGKTKNRIKVGRLPVRIVSTANGGIFATVATDKKIWAKTSARKGRTLTRLPHYPQDLAGDDDTLWVLNWVNGASSNISVTKIDVALGATTESDPLPGGGWGIASVGDTVWTAHEVLGETNRAVIVILEKQTLEERDRISVAGDTIRHLRTNDEAVFAAGFSSVAKFDKHSHKEVARKDLAGHRVFNIAASDEYVIATNSIDTVYVLSAYDLSLRRTINLETSIGPENAPHDIIIFGDNQLAIAASDSISSKKGYLVIVDDWVP